LVLRARGSPPAPRAGRDDCRGFGFGSAVPAAAGDQQHALLRSVLRARGSPPAPRAGRDDCSGFVFGSAVLADGRAALFSAGMTRREPGGLV
jgi:hypothetical protein